MSDEVSHRINFHTFDEYGASTTSPSLSRYRNDFVNYPLRWMEMMH